MSNPKPQELARSTIRIRSSCTHLDHFTVGNDIVCKDCYENHSAECQSCGERMWIIKLNQNNVCLECVNDILAET